MKAKAKQITLKTKKQVFGALSGNNLSSFQGEGFEFAELREYAYGDDVRKIDWKTSAKTGKTFVKVYHEERELNVVISTLLSGSTYFGTTIPKSEYMIEIMAILGFSAVRNRDLFSHILYADKLYRASKPTKKIFAIDKEVEEAINFEVLGKATNTKGWIEELNKRVRKKSLLILIGDFVGDYNLALLAKKHDVVAIIVRDYFIENPKPMGEIRLIDPGYLDSFSGNVDEDTIKIYKKALLENDKKLINHLKDIGAKYFKVYTHQDPYLQLTKRMR
jgi:uncharacterized protein (DUF58 family)